jgi:hypothetical protein
VKSKDAGKKPMKSGKSLEQAPTAIRGVGSGDLSGCTIYANATWGKAGKATQLPQHLLSEHLLLPDHRAVSMPNSIPPKRKGASSPNQQSDRKRLQNRISQQCFREKQATYIKHLEQFVNNVEESDGFEFSDASKNLQLIRENHLLRESLLDMRKKLLSFSAQATSMASMCI